MCLDEEDRVWFMLHSGSRGPGNRIGTVYIELAKNDMLKLDKQVKVWYFIKGIHYSDFCVTGVHYSEEK